MMFHLMNHLSTSPLDGLAGQKSPKITWHKKMKARRDAAERRDIKYHDGKIAVLHLPTRRKPRRRCWRLYRHLLVARTAGLAASWWADASMDAQPDSVMKRCRQSGAQVALLDVSLPPIQSSVKLPDCMHCRDGMAISAH